MARRHLVLAAALTAAGCGGAPGEQEVCEFLRSRTAAPALREGAASWEWAEHAQRIVESSRWVEVEGRILRRCTRDPQVERVSFASGGNHAQVTLNSFLLPAPADPAEIIEPSGSVETCLYRRGGTGAAVRWVGVACKLDAVS